MLLRSRKYCRHCVGFKLFRFCIPNLAAMTVSLSKHSSLKWSLQRYEFAVGPLQPARVLRIYLFSPTLSESGIPRKTEQSDIIFITSRSDAAFYHFPSSTKKVFTQGRKRRLCTPRNRVPLVTSRSNSAQDRKTLQNVIKTFQEVLFHSENVGFLIIYTIIATCKAPKKYMMWTAIASLMPAIIGKRSNFYDDLSNCPAWFPNSRVQRPNHPKCKHMACWHTYSNIGAHAQRGTWSVCLSVCLLFENSLLESLFAPQMNTRIQRRVKVKQYV